MIAIHPQLEKDCIPVGDFSLCKLLLLDDANYPWFILLPCRESVTEIHQLSTADQQQLLAESSSLCHCLEDVFQPDKLNVAAIGNMVPQLHIHHIARYRDDACWPAPVWGAVAKKHYSTEQADAIMQRVCNCLVNNGEQSFQPTPA